MAQADAAAEYPAAALVLDIEMVAQGPNGERTISADDFFITFLTTALEENEILTGVRVPAVPAGTGWSFQEMARRHGDFALVGAALSLRVEQGSTARRRVKNSSSARAPQWRAPSKTRAATFTARPSTAGTSPAC